MSDHRETHDSEHHCKLGGSTKEGKDNKYMYITRITENLTGN